MKRSLAQAGIVLLFASMLLSPKAVFNGASEGLLLWFQIILPTLFPFIMITNLLLYTDSVHYISRIFGTLLSHIFKVSKNGSFAVIAGFLCGYPMGAKVAGDLITGGYIAEEEGKYLLSFCNNTSPVFIMNFIIWKTLDREELLIPSIVILLGTPMLLSFIFRKLYLKGEKCFQNQKEEIGNRNRWNFQIMDDCIMNGFETITKVGGYIILFSVILSLSQSLPCKPVLLHVLLPSLEVTNGIAMIGKSNIIFEMKYPAIIGLTSFGGFCSAAQTQCMIQKTKIPLLPYIIEKLATAGAASLISFLYLHIV